METAHLSSTRIAASIARNGSARWVTTNTITRCSATRASNCCRRTRPTNGSWILIQKTAEKYNNEDNNAASLMATMASSIIPTADELRLRPLDVRALLDALEEGRLLPGSGLETDAVAMVGHSWGATTTLQVAGLRTTDVKLIERCQNLRDPERNLSWVLQCSWLKAAADGSLGDPRVKAAVAVSPPLRLLFDPGSGAELTAKVLLVSGSRDWLVPPGPEAVEPLREGEPLARGHRLVLASGGGHFNLRAPAGAVDPPVLAPLIEAWINQQLLPEAAFRFDAGGWGSDRLPLVDVTPRL